MSSIHIINQVGPQLYPRRRRRLAAAVRPATARASDVAGECKRGTGCACAGMPGLGDMLERQSTW